METNFVNLEGEGEGWVIYSISSDPPPPRIVYRLYCKGETPSGLANLPPPHPSQLSNPRYPCIQGPGIREVTAEEGRDGI